MSLNDASITVAAEAVEAAITHFSLHTTGGVSSSANESTAARVAVSGVVDGDGDITWTGPYDFTGGAASGPCVRVGYWSASSGGTYLGGSLLTGDQTFNAAGEYTVDSITESGTYS
jgi:hypothetical protein